MIGIWCEHEGFNYVVVVVEGVVNGVHSVFLLLVPPVPSSSLLSLLYLSIDFAADDALNAAIVLQMLELLSLLLSTVLRRILSSTNMIPFHPWEILARRRLNLSR
jgi:hypothetical protein